MDAHAGYIAAAFLASGLGIVGLVAWVVLEHRRLRRALAAGRGRT